MPLIESLWLQSGPTMYFSFLAPDMPWDASAHGEVLEALRRRTRGSPARGCARYPHDRRGTFSPTAPPSRGRNMRSPDF